MMAALRGAIQIPVPSSLGHLLQRNLEWAANLRARRPDFFLGATEQQTPHYLWIGCSDSRVPASDVVDLPPGEMFVHRNVANVVVHTDLNFLSVLQFAVEALKVPHVLIVGHYGCGGVRAAYQGKPLGLIDNWLRHVQDVAAKHRALLDRLPDDGAREDRLCELNVIEQLTHVARTTIVQDAWRRGQPLALHGWIYRLHDGVLRDLGLEVDEPGKFDKAYESAIAALTPPA
jgi:carbonic anhydrase